MGKTGAEQQIKEEAAKGIPPERIAVGGFSQGGHIALKSLFKASQPLAACIALSTWLEPGLNWEVTSWLQSVTCSCLPYYEGTPDAAVNPVSGLCNC